MKINHVQNLYTPSPLTKQSNEKSDHKLDKSENTTIQSRNEWESESDWRREILDKKYQKINEQNKRYANPKEHIYDKYRNPYSPKYRSDLTKVEREAAYDMENDMLKHGELKIYRYRDALNNNPYTKPTAGMALSYFGPQLHDLAKNGFDSIPDLELSIHYDRDGLHDIA